MKTEVNNIITELKEVTDSNQSIKEVLNKYQVPTKEYDKYLLELYVTPDRLKEIREYLNTSDIIVSNNNPRLQELLEVYPDIKKASDNGLVNVIPVNTNDKVPSLYKWKQYQKKKYNFKDLGTNKQLKNFAVIIGYNPKENGCLGCLDIDGVKDLGKDINQQLKDYHYNILKQLPNTIQEKSQSGGYHIYYRALSSIDGKAVVKGLLYPKDFFISELQNQPIETSNAIEHFTDNNRIVVIAPSKYNQKEPVKVKGKKTGKTIRVKGNYESIGTFKSWCNMKVYNNIESDIRQLYLNAGFTETKNDNVISGTTSYIKTNSVNTKPDNIKHDKNTRDLTTKEINDIIKILKPYFEVSEGKGVHNQVYLALGSYLNRHHIDINSAIKISDKLCELTENPSDYDEHTIDLKGGYKETKANKTGLPTLKSLIKPYVTDKDKFESDIRLFSTIINPINENDNLTFYQIEHHAKIIANDYKKCCTEKDTTDLFNALYHGCITHGLSESNLIMLHEAFTDNGIVVTNINPKESLGIAYFIGNITDNDKYIGIESYRKQLVHHVNRLMFDINEQTRIYGNIEEFGAINIEPALNSEYKDDINVKKAIIDIILYFKSTGLITKENTKLQDKILEIKNIYKQDQQEKILKSCESYSKYNKDNYLDNFLETVSDIGTSEYYDLKTFLRKYPIYVKNVKMFQTAKESGVPRQIAKNIQKYLKNNNQLSRCIDNGLFYIKQDNQYKEINEISIRTLVNNEANKFIDNHDKNIESVDRDWKNLLELCSNTISIDNNYRQFKNGGYYCNGTINQKNLFDPSFKDLTQYKVGVKTSGENVEDIKVELLEYNKDINLEWLFNPANKDEIGTALKVFMDILIPSSTLPDTTNISDIDPNDPDLLLFKQELQTIYFELIRKNYLRQLNIVKGETRHGKSIMKQIKGLLFNVRQKNKNYTVMTDGFNIEFLESCSPNIDEIEVSSLDTVIPILKNLADGSDIDVRLPHSKKDVSIATPPITVETNVYPTKFAIDVALVERLILKEYPNYFPKNNIVDPSKNERLSDPLIIKKIQTDYIGLSQIISLAINFGELNNTKTILDQTIQEKQDIITDMKGDMATFLKTQYTLIKDITEESDIATKQLALEEQGTTLDEIIEEYTVYLENTRGITWTAPDRYNYKLAGIIRKTFGKSMINKNKWKNTSNVTYYPLSKTGNGEPVQKQSDTELIADGIRIDEYDFKNQIEKDICTYISNNQPLEPGYVKVEFRSKYTDIEIDNSIKQLKNIGLIM